jgi:hypothetical protein
MKKEKTLKDFSNFRWGKDNQGLTFWGGGYLKQNPQQYRRMSAVTLVSGQLEKLILFENKYCLV